MKKTKIFIIITFLSLFLISCGRKNNDELLEKKMFPYEFMSMMKSYPDEVFDYRAFIDISQKETVALKSTKSNTEWRLEGPGNIGGRINVVEVHPTNSNIIFVGNASGGIYKTTDGGNTWYPVFDDAPYLAIGAIAFDPNNPNIMYAGTGDPNIGGYPFIGNGIYKSTDGGETWSNIGLSETSIISRIEVSPANSSVIYVATMGLPFERTPDRGLYKTTDGGTTWQKILYISDDAGIADILINPSNPQIIYATGWNRIRNRYESVTVGQAAKIYKTTDGGNSWNILTNGLPTEDLCRIGLCMSESNPDKIYAMYLGTDFEIYNIYKTTDAGSSWTALNISGLEGMMGGFGWYFGQIRLNPANDNEIYVLGVDMFRTTNGGTSWSMCVPEWWTYEVHADKHDLFYINSTTLLLATDGGLYKSTDNCATWTDIENIPNNQVYRITVNPFQDGVYRIGVQDNGTSDGNYSTLNEWVRVFGGDGFQPYFDPNNSDNQYVATQNGSLYSSQDGGYNFYDFSYTIEGTDRRAWDFPYIMSPHSSNTFFCGTYRVYKNTNAPYDYWTPISPDLTEGTDNRFHVISTISQSIINEDIIYSGASDGYVYRTLNGGTDWENISTGLPERYISCVKASSLDENTVFISNSGYMYNEYVPHLHKSDNNGDTWTDISGDLPQFGINDIWISASGNDEIIFVATDGGVYFTTNGGNNWTRAGSNMPIVTVYDIEYDEVNDRIIAGTYGKSVMSIDLIDLISLPSINPTTAIFYIDSSTDISTVITWNSGTQISSIYDGVSNLDANDYSLSANTLTIKSEFLETVLSEVNQTITLTITFDTGDTSELIITAKSNTNNISNLNTVVGVYPNPSNGIFNFNLDGEYKCHIFSLTGKQIATYRLNQSSSLIDLSTQISGIYIVNLTGNTSYSFYLILNK